MTVNGTAKRWNGAAWEYVGQLPLAHNHALTDIASLSTLPPRGVRRAASITRGLDPCAARSQWPGTGGLSNGTDTYGNYRSMHPVFDTANDLRLIFTNTYLHELVDVPNAIVVSAAIEYPSGTYWPVFFGGKRSVTIEPNGTVLSDPIGVQVPTAGTLMWVRTNVQPATGVGSGGVWPLAEAQSGGTSAGAAEGSETGTGANVDKTLTGTIATAGLYTYRPVVVVGQMTSIPSIVIGGAGDSIMAGSGDNTGPYADAGHGFLAKAIGTSKPFINLGTGGERAQYLAGDQTRRARGPLYTGCSHVIDNLAVNDLINNRTLAQLQADALASWTYLVNRGVTGLPGSYSGVMACTCTPRTASTDSWATTGNQTPFGGTASPATNEASRTGYNDWLRGGAPIDPTTKAAVAVGTAGALLAGAAGHPLAGYYETADTVETARNSGLWKVDGTANKWTTDGTHPQTIGHTAMAAAIDLTRLV